MYKGGSKRFAQGRAYLHFQPSPCLLFPDRRRCGSWRIILIRFGLNDKLLIHTVRTHVINYDSVFFIQNSCWENSGSSDLGREGTQASNFPGPSGHTPGIPGCLVLLRKRWQGAEPRGEVVPSGPLWVLGNTRVPGVNTWGCFSGHPEFRCSSGVFLLHALCPQAPLWARCPLPSYQLPLPTTPLHPFFFSFVAFSGVGQKVMFTNL